MKFLLSLVYIFVLSFMCNFSLAAWGSQGTDPVTILDSVKGGAGTNSTKLDIYGGTGKGVHGTLETIKNNIGPYIDWGVFIGLSMAVILIVYNAGTLVLSPLKEGQAATVKKRIYFIAVGIIILTGFYFIIKLVLSFVQSATG